MVDEEHLEAEQKRLTQEISDAQIEMKKASEKIGAPFLGSIPIELEVREGGDSGTPLMNRKRNSPATQAFREIADKLVESLENLE